jgi:uncharacterized membrane protein
MRQLDRVALWITTRVGSMTFFLLIFGWTVLWLGWNILTPPAWQFDPPMGFVLWLFISNLIQLLLMPLLLVGQTIQGRQSDERADRDLTINVRAEHEVEVILRHLHDQNTILLALAHKMNLNLADVVSAHQPSATPRVPC